jgi:hypothetical protein
MARRLDKLIKIEHPTKISEMKLETVKALPPIPTLDLMDIESFTGPEITCHIDLGLDQLEEQEE